jgi:hypothetical protein
MTDEIKLSKVKALGGEAWAVEYRGDLLTVSHLRVETRGETARLVVEMPVWLARALADTLGGLPFYPAPLDATEQLGHAVRELANAAGEMTKAARALQASQEPQVVMKGPEET